VPVVVEALVRGGDGGAAASFLTGPHAWDVLLGRAWGDDGEALARLVERAGAHPGEVGDRAVRQGLAALGSGLEDGDPHDWTVDRDTAAAVMPALGSALAAHVAVAAHALLSVADGDVGEPGGDVLRGLGYLTIDRDAASVVSGALYDWTLEQPTALAGTGPQSPLPAVAVPSAYIAVEQYGQRLAHALRGFEEQAAARSREAIWNLFVALPLTFVRGPWGVGFGAVEGYAATAFGVDGSWDNGPDRGLVLDREDAADAVPGTRAPADPDAVAAARQAHAIYDATLRALGIPRPPQPSDMDVLAPALDGLGGLVNERRPTLPTGSR
jgi:hypothetical protein